MEDVMRNSNLVQKDILKTCLKGNMAYNISNENLPKTFTNAPSCPFDPFMVGNKFMKENNMFVRTTNHDLFLGNAPNFFGCSLPPKTFIKYSQLETHLNLWQHYSLSSPN
jgi:hypothetical protein